KGARASPLAASGPASPKAWLRSRSALVVVVLCTFLLVLAVFTANVGGLRESDHDPKSRGRSLPSFPHGRVACPLPSRRAPRQRKTSRCVRPVPWLGLAPATYTQLCPALHPDSSGADRQPSTSPC